MSVTAVCSESCQLVIIIACHEDDVVLTKDNVHGKIFLSIISLLFANVAAKQPNHVYLQVQYIYSPQSPGQNTVKV